MDIRNWKILVVDDEPDSLILIQAILRHGGAAVIGVGSAEEALSIVETTKPTLIVIDLALPRMDGWGLLTRLNADPSLKAVPRVAITAFHTPVLASKAVIAGFDAFFPKPIDATRFVQDLAEIIQDKQNASTGDVLF